jgi:hypothetical protein
MLIYIQSPNIPWDWTSYIYLKVNAILKTIFVIIEQKNLTKYTTNKCKPNLKRLNSCLGLFEGVKAYVHLEFELHIIQNPLIPSISHDYS